MVRARGINGPREDPEKINVCQTFEMRRRSNPRLLWNKDAEENLRAIGVRR